jgi:pimeloyl-ACP methyl ester carboxylesterase
VPPVLERPSDAPPVPAEPLHLAEQGTFFVHGSPTESEANSGEAIPIFDLDLGASGLVTSGQMYVEYQVPVDRRPGAPPLVLVHGGGHTGACWRTTPDGREGWATSFVRRGYAVYVVDQVTRGRSGFDASPVNAARRTGDTTTIPNIFQFSLDTLWVVFRFGPRPGEFYDDARFPRLALAQYLAQLVPDFNFGIDDPLVSVSALASLLDVIGPAVVVTHSQSGDFGFHLSVLRPGLVRGIVEVEGASTVDDTLLDVVHAKVPFLTVYGDHLADQPLYAATSAAAAELVDRLIAAKGDATYLHLPAAGVTGNGHMMMLETNSEEIAGLIDGWIAGHVG